MWYKCRYRKRLLIFQKLLRALPSNKALNSGSAQVQILFAACWRFTVASISDNAPGWKIRLNTFCRSTIPQKQFIIIITPSFESSRNRGVNVLKSLIIRFMCVCLHSMTLVASSDCNDVCDTHEMYGSTILCCEYILGASAKVVLFRFQIYHISPPKTKLQHADKMEIKRYHILAIFKKII